MSTPPIISARWNEQIAKLNEGISSVICSLVRRLEGFSLPKDEIHIDLAIELCFATGHIMNAPHVPHPILRLAQPFV
jgi:hypothetical protein